MIDYNLIQKYSPDEKELDEMYGYRNEPMDFPWLSNVRKWLEETYGAKVLTIAHRQQDKTHFFYVFLWYRDDMEKIPHEMDKKLLELRINTAEKKIQEYIDEEVLCLIAAESFDSKVRGFIARKAADVKAETAALFEHLNPCYLSDMGNICVLPTKNDAKAFLLSEDYQNIRKQLSVILKKLDRYDVFTENDVRIFVDYKQNMDRTPMWGMWARELSREDMDKYEDSIING